MPRDAVIELAGLRVPARIGVTDAELEHDRDLVFAIAIHTTANAATESDAIGDTVDYCAVAELVSETVGSVPHRTLERLAAKVADAIAERFEPAEVEVRCAKPGPPVSADLAEVAVRVSAGAP